MINNPYDIARYIQDKSRSLTVLSRDLQQDSIDTNANGANPKNREELKNNQTVLNSVNS